MAAASPFAPSDELAELHAHLGGSVPPHVLWEIAHLQGIWWLLPEDNGRTLLVYELALDPGMPIPRFLVRATLKRDLPKVLAAVRARAEAAAP